MNNFDNLLFENRNKSYGAYALRKKYFKHICIALFISIVCFVIISVFAYVKSANIVTEYAESDFQHMIVEYEEYAMLKNIDSLILRNPPIKKIKKESEKFEVVDTIKPVIDTLLSLKTPDEKDDTLKYDSLASNASALAGNANGTGSGNLWVKVGTLPTPPCGFDGLKKFQAMYTKYPEEAKKNKIQGDVEVEIFVRKDGTVEKIAISRSVDPLLDNEALRITNVFLLAYPKWTPGKRNGMPVDFLTYLKFKFRMF